MKTTLKLVGFSAVSGLAVLGVLGVISARREGLSTKDVLDAVKQASTPI